ncbi:unnamed protein product [Protopolystoma xenopodis]|uniref:Uncharacterized protein n=1 Tax=Protopolystoma xenopodis TaxID=117903 RepID=A0A3S5BDJ3_9PLAT|nr:unnamed protein product [Protopolystoma xenopodis]
MQNRSFGSHGSDYVMHRSNANVELKQLVSIVAAIDDLRDQKASCYGMRNEVMRNYRPVVLGEEEGFIRALQRGQSQVTQRYDRKMTLWDPGSECNIG